MSKKHLLKRANEKPFVTHNAQYGDYGGGTQPPVYLDKQNNKVPEASTKWAKLKKIVSKKIN